MGNGMGYGIGIIFTLHYIDYDGTVSLRWSF